MRQDIWHQHNSCSALYWIAEGDALYLWIGKPGLTPPDFFWWGYLNYAFYRQSPTTRENMKQRNAEITPGSVLNHLQQAH